MKEDNTPIDPTWMQKTGGFAKDMTLHQWYAGLAMQSLIVRADIADIVGVADELAGAMLKAMDAQ